MELNRLSDGQRQVLSDYFVVTHRHDVDESIRELDEVGWNLQMAVEKSMGQGGQVHRLQESTVRPVNSVPASASSNASSSSSAASSSSASPSLPFLLWPFRFFFSAVHRILSWFGEWEEEKKGGRRQLLMVDHRPQSASYNSFDNNLSLSCKDRRLARQSSREVCLQGD